MSEPPAMFRRPTDPPAPLPSLRSGQQIVQMHVEWARLHQASAEHTTFARRLRTKVSSIASRVGGRDRRFLGFVVRAVDDVAARCDELSQRVDNLAISLDDLARTLGEELTQLRAVVESTPATEPQRPRSSLP